MGKVDYKFLFDWGVSLKLRRFFRPADVKSTEAFGLTQRAKDNIVVAVAEFNARTIVTHDKKLVRYVLEHQGDKELHRCLLGLVVLPNNATQESALRDVLRKRRILRYKDNEIGWDAVWRYNLYVPLTRPGDPPISALCRCGEKKFDMHFAPKPRRPKR